MYSAIWRHLPGPAPVKAIIAIVIIAAIVLLLFQVVFPWVQDVTGIMDITVPTEESQSILPWAPVISSFFA